MPTLEEILGVTPAMQGMTQLDREMPLEGLKMLPKIGAAMAMKLLEFVLPLLDIDSKERKAIVKAIEQLDSITQDVTIEDLRGAVNILIQSLGVSPGGLGVGPGAAPSVQGAGPSIGPRVSPRVSLEEILGT